MRDIKVKDSYGDDLIISKGYTPEDLPAVHLDYDGERAYGLNELDKLIVALQEARYYLTEEVN